MNFINICLNTLKRIIIYSDSFVPTKNRNQSHAVHPIAALQSEYSLLTRDVEGEILSTVRELGISLVPYSPLARGLVTNKLDLTTLAADDFRKSLPRYQQENSDNNAKLVSGFAEIAAAKNCTPAQLALAWVLAQGEDIIPIPGTKNGNIWKKMPEQLM